MKTIHKIVLVFVLATLVLSGCKKDFVELNTDPNTMSKGLPQSLFAPAITQAVRTNMVRCRTINNELMQVTIDRGDTDYKVFRYDIRGTLANHVWNAHYITLHNLRDVYVSAEELLDVNSGNTYLKTYMAMSLITQSWLFSILTDMYGDIPYSEALRIKDDVIYPKFDRQEDIYRDIFAKLEEANALLTGGQDLPEEMVDSDPVYKGNAAKWRKFGNSLYLRLLMRVSGRIEGEVAGKFQEILVNGTKYPLFASNDDSAVLRWTGVVPYDSPFRNMRTNQWTDPKLTEFFVDHLNNMNDPRIKLWASTYNGPYYVGIPVGYPVGNPPVPKSRFLVALQNEPLLGTMMGYAELQLILAEAAVRGWIINSAKDYYEGGITAAITTWGVAVPANYLSQSIVAWNEGYDLDQKMQLIHLQKYYAMFYQDFQQWYEYRRTGYPVLYTGTGFENDGKMPSRLNYPTYLYATNRANLEAAIATQGGDDINTRVWWDY